VKVVITDCALGPITIEKRLLEEIGARVVQGDCHTEAEVVRLGRDADALIVHWAPVTAAVIANLDRCRVVSRYGIGVDTIDISAAAAHGIAVANVPDYCVEEVATHTLALLLAVHRQVVVGDRSVRGGDWRRPTLGTPMARLSQMTIGLVGWGRIARRVAVGARALGMRVLAYDPYQAAEAHLVPLPQLLAEADIVSLHCPLTTQNSGLIGEPELRRMKPTAILINTARGELMDEAALASALKAGRLAGAALDVYSVEPPPPAHPLLEAPNLLLTPHLAWYSDAALPDLQRGAAQNVVDYLMTGQCGNTVNGVTSRPPVAS